MRAHIELEMPGAVAAAVALWLDTKRWPAFIDGFGHVVDVEGDWPNPGATVVWQSTPEGRGRVLERVVSYDPLGGQATEVDDQRMTGTQRIEFEQLAEGVKATLELEYRLKGAGPMRWVTDFLFIRRAFNDSLRRTLDRFPTELKA